jgi:tRNA-dihydrouridine synthase A
MLHVSTREFRQLFRILSKRVVLWTEMVVDELVYHNHEDRSNGTLETHLGYDDTNEHPVICQLGGIVPSHTALATQLAVERGYDEINLNVGCPSDRVSGKREFGAVLMKQLSRLLLLVQAMRENAGDTPISVKCRLGVDDWDSWEVLEEFVDTLRPYYRIFYVHARKCLLQVLSPAQNRLVPPLNYPRVYRLCERFPDCDFYINGGIPGLRAAKTLCYGTAVMAERGNDQQETDSGVAPLEMLPTISTEEVPSEGHHAVPCELCKLSNGSCIAPPSVAPGNLKGCMLGRAAMDHAAQFWDVDRFIYGEPSNPCRNRREVLTQYAEYLERTYPRRCCDDQDDYVTAPRWPSTPVEHTKAFCTNCAEFYCLDDLKDGESNCITLDDVVPSVIGPYKVSSRVLERCLKPVWSLLHHMPQAKNFRKACDRYGQSAYRNCGPAIVLRKAMQVLPDNVWDRDFVRTDDVKNDDLVIRTAPTPSCDSCHVKQRH